MKTVDDLSHLLQRLDGRGYKAYAELRGAWALDGVILFVDRVQGDPFASPSRVRLRVPLDEAGIPPSLHANRVREMALRDAIARSFGDAIAMRGGTSSRERERHGSAARSDGDRGRHGGRGRTSGGGSGSGKSNWIAIDAGAQTVLERSAVVFGADFIEARLEVGLPAAGRRILGRAAEALLCDTVPALAHAALRWSALPQASIRHFVACVENQEHMRGQLAERGLVAFVANGARLPRRAGNSDRPMPEADCVAFETPPSLEVELDLLHPTDAGVPDEGVGDDGGSDAPLRIRGMGIPLGVTLIVGGGYHGKSTLLQALERCVFPHVPGDGREWVVAAPDLVKVRAEDGRPVTGVDLRPFIGQLPSVGPAPARSTACFTTSDASGSTSQAASIIESLEAGASGLLLDEDTCATNFMLRDARMQALVADADEPITPFVDRVRTLADECGVSTVLVMGGSGDYFDVADTVIALRSYRAEDVTARAKAIARAQETGRHEARAAAFAPLSTRRPLAPSLDARRGRRDDAIKVRDRHAIVWGEHEIDLRGVAQLADASQTRAIAGALLRARDLWMATAPGEGAAPSVAELLDRIERLLDEEGPDALALDHRDRNGAYPGALARPRRHEVAATLNRLRGLCLA